MELFCSKCQSKNVTIQVVNECKLVNKHHGIFWWISIGWLWIFIKWMIFTLPALILKIFGRKKQKIKNKTYKLAVCQDCGNSWKL